MNEAHRRLEIGGTIFTRRVQRTALNTEAKFLLLRHAFEAMAYHVVQLRTEVLNARSHAAIEQLEATRDGTLHAHMVMATGACGKPPSIPSSPKSGRRGASGLRA